METCDTEEPDEGNLHVRICGGLGRAIAESTWTADGQEVEVQVHIASPTPTPANRPPLSEGLAKLYSVLGERYDSGCTDTAARHNEHQP
jgi:hypothetical protein